MLVIVLEEPLLAPGSRRRNTCTAFSNVTAAYRNSGGELMDRVIPTSGLRLHQIGELGIAGLQPATNKK